MAYEDDIIKRAEDALARENFDYAITLLFDIVMANPMQRRARSLLHQAEIRKFQRKGRSAGAMFSGLMRGLTSHFSTKDPNKAIPALEKALRDDPGNISMMLDLAAQLKAALMLDQAIDTLELARELENQNLDVLRTLVYYYEESNDFGKAQLRASEYVKIAPNDKEMASKLKDVSAKRHIELSRVDKAKSFRDQLMDEEKAHQLEKGDRIVRSEDEMQKAVASSLAAIKENPNDAVAYNKLGDLYQQAGRLNEAMEAYKSAFKIGKDYPTREKIGDVALRIYASRVKAAEDALAAKPNDPAAAKRLADARHQLAENSLKEYEFRVKSHPTDLGLRFKLAAALFNSGHFDRAIQEFQQTVVDPKVKVHSQWYLGRCFMKKDLPDLAINQYKAALAAPGLSQQMKKEITYNLGEAYEHMGEREEARKVYQQIFEVDIAYKDVAQKVTQLRSTK